MKKFISICIVLTFLFSSPVSASILCPSDPLFSSQWELYNNGQVVNKIDGVTYKAWTPGVDINAVEAWGMVYSNINIKRDPIIIAVIDTGVNYNHDDLKDRILRDSSGNIVGYDYVDSDADPMDNNGHGTAVASIAAASGNNSIGMSGVIWDAKIMPVRILDNEGVGEVSKIKAAIRFAADHGANIINLSVVSNSYDDSLTESIDYAYGKGALIVAAAGNDGVNLTDYPRSPINNDGDRNIILGVGAVNSADQKFAQSNCGKGVDISVPGTNILGAYYNKTKNTSEYEFVSGTSASAAIVSGAAALIKYYHKDWSNKKIMDSVLTSVSPFKTALADMGAGRLNLAAALGKSVEISINEGQAVKILNRSTVYIRIWSNALVPISSAEAFLRLGYQWNEIIEVPEYAALAPYEMKLPISADWLPSQGNLVKGSGQVIYLVERNSLRAFETWQAFISRGYSLNQVNLISDVIISAYKKGSNIK